MKMSEKSAVENSKWVFHLERFIPPLLLAKSAVENSKWDFHLERFIPHLLLANSAEDSSALLKTERL